MDSPLSKGVGRKISRGGQRKKTRPKNSTIKSPSALSVSCMKIQGRGHGPILPPLPTLVPLSVTKVIILIPTMLNQEISISMNSTSRQFGWQDQKLELQITVVSIATDKKTS